MIFRRALPHLLIILSVMMLTLYIVDFFNNGMILRGTAFKTLLLIYIIAAILSSAMLMLFNARRK